MQVDLGRSGLSRLHLNYSILSHCPPTRPVGELTVRGHTYSVMLASPQGVIQRSRFKKGLPAIFSDSLAPIEDDVGFVDEYLKRSVGSSPSTPCWKRDLQNGANSTTPLPSATLPSAFYIRLRPRQYRWPPSATKGSFSSDITDRDADANDDTDMDIDQKAEDSDKLPTNSATSSPIVKNGITTNGEAAKKNG